MRPRDIEAVRVGAYGAPGAGGAFAVGETLRIISWNVHKGLDARLAGDLSRMAEERGPHIFALQESRPDLVLPTGYGGHHATSFRRRLQGAHEGVMTLSSIEPLAAHRVRSSERELFFLTPKAALISLFALDDGRSLCLLNLHGLNFDPSGRQLARQLEGLKGLVAHLDGPLVIAGDFNTWNVARYDAVARVVHDLELTEVAPDVPGGRKGGVRGRRLEKLVGLDRRLHLDRLFVRGLEGVRASWLEHYEGSDHVALFAELIFQRARKRA